jgi:hypothetical protein
MANYILKKGDDYVEVPTTDATAIAAWIALGYINLGTSVETVSPTDTLKGTDLVLSGKIILGSLEGENSWEIANTSGTIYIKGFTGGSYVNEFALTRTGASVTLKTLQGVTGLVGTTGVAGVAGATGVQGVTGLVGTTGLIGATGLDGAQGETGAQGLTGLDGAQGETGVSA